MDKKYLAEIKAREQVATKGPWYADGWGSWDDDLGEYIDLDDTNADARFIAHARADIPALISEVERLTEENDVLKSECKAHIRQAQEQEAKDEKV